MKSLQRLSYCSRARGNHGNNVPPDLASIVIQGRRFNHSHHVTGYLSYRQGVYFQVIEGPTEVIDDLYNRISRDPRHSDVTTLVREFGVANRLFQHWHLQLASGQELSAEIVQYLSANQDALKQLDRNGRKLLRPFFRLNRSAEENTDHSFPSIEKSGTFEFRLRASPLRLDQLDHLAERMEIVAMLLRHWFPFEMLCEASGHSPEFVHATLAHPLLSDVIQFRETRGDDSRRRKPVKSAARQGASASPSLYGELKSMFSRLLRR